jgi:hypothetical protein
MHGLSLLGVEFVNHRYECHFPRLNYGVFQSPEMAEELLHVHEMIFQLRTEGALVKKFIKVFRAIIETRRSNVLSKNAVSSIADLA